MLELSHIIHISYKNCCKWSTYYQVTIILHVVVFINKAYITNISRHVIQQCLLDHNTLTRYSIDSDVQKPHIIQALTCIGVHISGKIDKLYHWSALGLEIWIICPRIWLYQEGMKRICLLLISLPLLFILVERICWSYLFLVGFTWSNQRSLEVYSSSFF